jgi:hypothetical protein
MRIYSLLLGFVLVVFACQPASAPAEDTSAAPAVAVDTAAHWIQRTVEAHGGNRYDTAHYQFVFRDKTYTFHNEGVRYSYTRTFQKEGDTLLDSLWNTGFSRHQNGEAVALDEETAAKYGNALNSVIYFATLPHKLLDPAVIATYAGTNRLKGQDYAVLTVRFREAGGGDDFDDEYRYWIHLETHRIDYLAYSYQVERWWGALPLGLQCPYSRWYPFSGLRELEGSGGYPTGRLASAFRSRTTRGIVEN